MAAAGVGAGPPPPASFYQQQLDENRGLPPPPVVAQNLSPSEQRVLQACRNESFWYRSMPFGTISAAAVHFMIKQNILKPSAKWGSGPKFFLGGLFGFFLGKFSYIKTCEDKFLEQAPNTNIANMVRQRRGLPLQEVMVEESSPPQDQDHLGLGVPQGAMTGNYDEMRRRNREQNLPMPPPPQGGSPMQQPTAPFGEHAPTVEIQDGGAASSYDELRRMNRQQTLQEGQARPPWQPVPPSPPSQDPIQPSPPLSSRPLYSPPSKLPSSKSKYGDDGFE